jgi:endoglucanase
VRELIQEEIKGYSTNIKVDSLGNLIFRMGKKKENGLCIMIAAHMDEIGIIASHVEKNGLVRFSNIGTVLPRYLPGSRVRFLNGTRGVINSEKPEDPSKHQPISKFFVDVGASSSTNCPVKVGDLAVFDREFIEIGDSLASKALDDRASCGVLIESIKQIKDTPHELVFVFSTQEEVGSKGAQTAAFGIDADLGFAVDVTPAGNLLGVKMQCDLGSGPAIKVRDVNYISDPKVVNWMVDGAKKSGVPYQLEVLDIGSTDARVMQVSKAGMLSGALSLPCRYVHSPSEMISMKDYENMISLLVHLLSNPVQFKRK